MRPIAVVILLLCSLLLNAQTEQRKWPFNEFSVLYMGEKLSHPGVKLEVVRDVSFRKDSVRKIHRIDYGMGLAGYVHPRNHFGLRTVAQATYLYQTRKGFEFGAMGDAGFMRRFYHGRVFEVDEKGKVTRRRFIGQNAFTYGMYFVFGKRTLFREKALRWMLQVGTFWEGNYNGYSLVHSSVCLGIVMDFNRL